MIALGPLLPFLAPDLAACLAAQSEAHDPDLAEVRAAQKRESEAALEDGLTA